LSGSKRKIAVTGATGQIGGALVRLLAGESGLQVVEAAAPSSSLKTSEAAHRCTRFLLLYVRGKLR